MEKAGKKLDETAEEAQNAIEDGCENLKENLTKKGGVITALCFTNYS